MYKKLEVASLTTRGARTLLTELSEVLSDAEVLRLVQNYEVFIDQDDCPCAVVPAEICRFATEHLIYLDFDDVDVDTAVPGEDYGFDGDDR